MKSNLLPFAMDFASFLIQKIEEKENIKNIILFGSVARGEDTEASDVDIFIDIVTENSGFEKKVNSCLYDFINSVKYKNYWKLLGVESEIQLKIGGTYSDQE